VGCGRGLVEALGVPFESVAPVRSVPSYRGLQHDLLPEPSTGALRDRRILLGHLADVLSVNRRHLSLARLADPALAHAHQDARTLVAAQFSGADYPAPRRTQDHSPGIEGLVYQRLRHCRWLGHLMVTSTALVHTPVPCARSVRSSSAAVCDVPKYSAISG